MRIVDRISDLFGVPRCAGCGSRNAPYTHSMTDNFWCADCYPR